jgi:hypothetical protein
MKPIRIVAFFIAELAACGGKVELDTQAPQCPYGGTGGAGRLGREENDAGVEVIACGDRVCTQQEFCVAKCEGSPTWCTEPDPLGCCGAGEELSSVCPNGPAAGFQHGCLALWWTYSCHAWLNGETEYACDAKVPIESNGVARCVCHD